MSSIIKWLKCIFLSNILSLQQDCDIGGADHCGIWISFLAEVVMTYLLLYPKVC